MAAFQENVIYGHGDLNPKSFSHVTRYSTFEVFSHLFKTIEIILGSGRCARRWAASRVLDPCLKAEGGQVQRGRVRTRPGPAG